MDIASPLSSPRKPGARKLQILQTLAAMLEDPKGEKITTAALAARLDVSEAALYRHFASKAQMFEGLIEFIETTIFGLINEISAKETSGLKQARSMIVMLLDFAQTNRGMTRVLIGDALVNENERLQERMNQLIERIESSLKQSYRLAVTEQELPDSFDAAARVLARGRLRAGPLAPLREERFPQGARGRAGRAAARAAHLGLRQVSRQRPPHTAQAGSRRTRTACQRMASASSISSRPSSDSPIPAASLSASAAWVVPMMPVRGANTPITAHNSSSPSPGGNRHA